MGTGDFTVTQVTDFVLKLQYVFSVVVIFETVMSAGHKTQKESYACQEDLRVVFFLFVFWGGFIFFILFIFFFFLLLLFLSKCQ